MLIPRRRRHWLLPHITKFAPSLGPSQVRWAPYDDFNRPGPALGPDWTDLAAGFLIVANEASPTVNTATTVWTVPPPIADYWAEVTTPQPAIGPNAAGVAVRVTTGNTFYSLAAIYLPPTIELYRFVLGVQTPLAAYAYPGPNVRLRLSVVGTTLIATINGAPQAPVIDAILPGPGRAGIINYPRGVALQPVDNFSAGY